MKTSKDTLILLDEFAKDVSNGLEKKEKRLPSRYFYDEKGDQIFQQIMHMPEYYLTDCEYEIFSMQSAEIIKAVNFKEEFDLIELGAGDGYKTKLFIKELLHSKVPFHYYPVDISENALRIIENNMLSSFPELQIHPTQNDYFDALFEISKLSHKPKLVLFLGSNIGNLTIDESHSFLSKLNSVLNKGDKLLIGIDLKKNPKTILDAYDDPHGITKSFNLNLLDRINQELGANFNIPHFDHYPFYDPVSGTAKSFLVSLKNQEVFIEALDKSFHFDQYELVHTEISQKYSLDEIEALASATGFRINKPFLDCKHYFVDSLFEV